MKSKKITRVMASALALSMVFTAAPAMTAKAEDTETTTYKDGDTIEETNMAVGEAETLTYTIEINKTLTDEEKAAIEETEEKIMVVDTTGKTTVTLLSEDLTMNGNVFSGTVDVSVAYPTLLSGDTGNLVVFADCAAITVPAQEEHVVYTPSADRTADQAAISYDGPDFSLMPSYNRGAAYNGYTATYVFYDLWDVNGTWITTENGLPEQFGITNVQNLVAGDTFTYYAALDAGFGVGTNDTYDAGHDKDLASVSLNYSTKYKDPATTVNLSASKIHSTTFYLTKTAVAAYCFGWNAESLAKVKLYTTDSNITGQVDKCWEENGTIMIAYTVTVAAGEDDISGVWLRHYSDNGGDSSVYADNDQYDEYHEKLYGDTVTINVTRAETLHKFNWAEDGKTCTMSYYSAADETYFTDPVDCTVTSTVKTEPTCSQMGTTEYTATYGSFTDTKDLVDIPTVDHVWGSPVYVWSNDEDDYSCQLLSFCEYNCGEQNTTDCQVTSETLVAATCTQKGVAKYTAKGSVDGVDYENSIYGIISATGHDYKEIVTPASLTENGTIVKKCSACDDIESTTTLYSPKAASLSATSFTYNGKVQQPKITVTDTKGKTIAPENYTVSYSGDCKSVGTYTATITFTGDYYTGSMTKTFTIVPKGTSLSSLTAGSKCFTAKWTKQATQTSGYVIQYATNSKFTGAKSITVAKNSTTSQKVTKLTGNKKYYVRICTYKTVGGKKICSAWSAAKTVTTKK